MASLYESIKATWMTLWNLTFHTSQSETRTTAGGENTGRRCMVPTSNGANARDGTSKQSNSNSEFNQLDYNSLSWDSLIGSSEGEQEPPWSLTSKPDGESEQTQNSYPSTPEPTEYLPQKQALLEMRDLLKAYEEKLKLFPPRWNESLADWEKKLLSPPPITPPERVTRQVWNGQIGMPVPSSGTFNPSSMKFLMSGSTLNPRPPIASSVQSGNTATNVTSPATCGNPRCFICNGGNK